MKIDKLIKFHASFAIQFGHQLQSVHYKPGTVCLNLIVFERNVKNSPRCVFRDRDEAALYIARAEKLFVVGNIVLNHL